MVTIDKNIDNSGPDEVYRPIANREF